MVLAVHADLYPPTTSPMAKPVPLPGYTTTKRKLPAIQLMFQELGAQDACIQLQELCITYMENSAAATKAPLGDFLKLLYAGNDIPHGTYSFAELKELSAKSYLIVTYALLEKTLIGIISDTKATRPALAATWKSKTPSGGGLPPLLELTQNIPAADRAILEAAPEFRLIEYYRTVRVANSHIKGSTAANVISAFASLSAGDLQHFSRCYGLRAPNPPSDISFEDFKLFTRAIKYYSNLINEACG